MTIEINVTVFPESIIVWIFFHIGFLFVGKNTMFEKCLSGNLFRFINDFGKSVYVIERILNTVPYKFFASIFCHCFYLSES